MSIIKLCIGAIVVMVTLMIAAPFTLALVGIVGAFANR